MAIIKQPPTQLGWFHPLTISATFFWSGLMKPAPGTWGSAAALPFAYAIAYYFDPLALLPAALVAFFIGLATSGRYADAAALKDPGEVVIDEVAGQWVALALVPADPLLYLAGFGLFRFFDIVKVWPASLADKRLTGAVGIMVDDVISGIMAMIVLWAGYQGYLHYV